MNKSTASPRPLLRTASQRARRQRIIDAGLALLNRRDFGQIQVKDVADEANVALGTVYHYFSSKEHLFAEVIIQWAGTLRTSITRRPLTGSTPADKLAEALHRSVRAFQRQPSLARLVATLEVSSDPVAAEILNRLSETTTAIYLDQLHGVPPETAAAVVRVSHAVFASLLRSWSSGQMGISEVHSRLDETVRLVLGSPA